jgi:hypothetical protein
MFTEPSSPVVPARLVDALRAGRCVAFVGAGFSAPAVPTWTALLRAIAAQNTDPRLAPVREALARVRVQATPSTGSGEAPAQEQDREPTVSALELEAYGQLLKDAWVQGGNGDAAWEAVVQQVIDAHAQTVPHAIRTQIETRLRALREMPVRAILTTNFDAFLGRTGGSDTVVRPSTPDTFAEVLRGPHPWFARRPWEKHDEPRAPVVKLHGDANGNPHLAPLVFARRDYRRLLHESPHHTNFLRALFATHTVLFLGVSFTDAYLNELRSEVLSLIGRKARGADDEPWGYAIVGDKTPAWRQYLRDHEGIEPLAYQSNAGDHGGFDTWLRAIADATSTVGRLQAALRGRNTDGKDGRKVVWVDPAADRNAPGHEVLKKALGDSAVVARRDAASLQREDRDAALIITHLGYRDDESSTAKDVLRALHDEAGPRPPVIVFASGKKARTNRSELLRCGAWEYASSFEELVQLIDQLFCRRDDDR